MDREEEAKFLFHLSFWDSKVGGESVWLGQGPPWTKHHANKTKTNNFELTKHHINKTKSQQL